MVRKKLLNFSTEIAATKTASEIMEILAKHGAKSAHVEFDDQGNANSLSFLIKTASGTEIPIRLPINASAVLNVMEKQNIEPHYLNEYQAARTAWRIVKSWVEAQLAILETEMVTMEEIFLPYLMVSDNKTLYQKIAETRFQLPSGQ